VPAGPINDMGEALNDPQIAHRGMRIAPGGVPGVRAPIRFSDADLALDRPAPALGADTEAVLDALSGAAKP
jgi:crotonobetainyl-CoA:carnitine CoA-transferase CaiB-like acyl-CoA transferase